jgi:uncharacterized protein (TIGR03435 family)
VISIASISAQQASNTNRLAFEVASVKPNPNDVPEGISLSPNGDVRFTGFRVRTLIAMVYGGSQLLDQFVGPPWTSTDRFDIVAKAGGDISTSPQGRRSDRLIAMMRTLLEDRFQVRVHTETREKPVFTLRLARRDGRPGPQMKESSVECPRFVTGAPPPRVDPDHWCGIRALGGTITGRGVPASQIAGNLAGYPAVGRVVLDRTGLAGRYDFQVEYSPESGDPAIPRVDGRPDLFTALREQLGLTLQPGTAPLEVVVIDRVERPTPD